MFVKMCCMDVYVVYIGILIKVKWILYIWVFIQSWYEMICECEIVYDAIRISRRNPLRWLCKVYVLI